jgi:hypothetical protein
VNNTEYILEFINSNSVYKHLIDINYEPDSLTAAFIVWQGQYPLAEKEKTFEWIIDNMPDMPIPSHEYHAGRDSLHEFLSKYMKTLSRYINTFKADCYDAVYDFTSYYDTYHENCVDDDNIYSSFENVLDAMQHSIPQNWEDYPDAKKPILFRIRRRTLDVEAGSDYLYFTPEFDIYSFSADTVMPVEEYEILHLFENLCLPIPHPFRRGDIIRECRKYSIPIYNDTLVVTGYMSEEKIKKNFSTLNMHHYTLYGICSDGNGGTYEDSIDHYLNAEFVNPGDVLIKDCVLLEKSYALKSKLLF